MKDIRDPTKVGEKLLRRREAVWGKTPLSVIADFSPLRVPDYVGPRTLFERYGDPRLKPSTLPN